MAGQRQKSEAKEKERKGPSALEWTSAMIGAMIAIGILVFIAMEAIQSAPGKPPLLQVRPVGLVAEQGLYVVEVKIENRAAQTAAAVEIEGEIKQGGSAVETSNATVTYVPGHSERRAGLIFTRDPRRYSFQVRATGYEQP